MPPFVRCFLFRSIPRYPSQQTAFRMAPWGCFFLSKTTCSFSFCGKSPNPFSGDEQLSNSLFPEVSPCVFCNCHPFPSLFRPCSFPSPFQQSSSPPINLFFRHSPYIPCARHRSTPCKFPARFYSFFLPHTFLSRLCTFCLNILFVSLRAAFFIVGPT